MQGGNIMSWDMVITDLERIKLEQQQLQSITQDLVKNASQILDELLTTVKAKHESTMQKEKEVQELKEKRRELESTNQAISSDIDSVQKSIEQKDAEIETAQKKLRELEMKLDDLKKKEINVKQEVTFLTEQLQEMREKFEKVTSEKQQEEEKHKQHVQSLVDEKERLEKKNRKLEQRFKALLYLIKKQYVNPPEVNIIRTMVQSGVNNVNVLEKSTGLEKQIITKTLQNLNSRGLIEFNSASGEFKILKQFDI